MTFYLKIITYSEMNWLIITKQSYNQNHPLNGWFAQAL